ncbi:MAG: serine hydrolase [Bacteroidota bacterium]
MKNRTALLSILLLSHFTCLGQETYLYKQPVELNDGWKTGSLNSYEIDTTRIYPFFTQIQTEKNKLHSVILIKDGKLVLEEYLNGHSAQEPHDMRSVTKSIRSLLLGIAIDEGFIHSVDDPVSTYLTNPTPRKNLDPRKKDITIKHLITMSTGLDCNDWDKKSRGQEDKVHRKKDWLQYTLDLPMINDPGEVSTYCSMGSVLAAEIISRSAGMTIEAFAQKYLFEPLGITNVRWGHTSRKKVIPSGKRVYMTSRDMAKIGLLVQQEGMWNGRRIVSKTWIEESTTPTTTITGIDYGYLWWTIPFKSDERIFSATLAMGNGGQYIMMFPEIDLIAVFTGGAYNSEEDKLPFTIMNRIFLPAFVGENR